MTVRTRFAPSPTGYLHVGSARTALFSWLYARQQGGQFILRIEDTDLERSTETSVQAILDGMSWLDLNYDEGPIYQSHRFDQYRAAAEQLLNQGKAYRCTCSRQRIATLREQQLAAKQKPRYDGHCRDKDISATTTEEYVIRFKNPLDGDVVFADQVYGDITVSNSELDDVILLRSDGVPTYNFTVVVDDSAMKITHVIRGDDHINNTPRQINLIHALNFPIPTYAHLPMILGKDGKRLSKRHGAVSVLQFSEEGYLPEALLNYLVRLGWSHGDQEIFTRDEMIKYFNLAHVNRAAAAFNMEKLTWLNHHYLQHTPRVQLADQITQQLEKMGIAVTNEPPVIDVVALLVERSDTIIAIAEQARLFYETVVTYDDDAVAKQLTSAIKPALQQLVTAFTQLAQWTASEIHSVIEKTAEQHQLKFGKLAQPLRVALTGSTSSPAITDTACLLGRAKVIARVTAILERIT